LPLLPKRRGDRVFPLGPRGPWSFGGGGHVWGARATCVGSLRASLVTLLVGWFVVLGCVCMPTWLKAAAPACSSVCGCC